MACQQIYTSPTTGNPRGRSGIHDRSWILLTSMTWDDPLMYQWVRLVAPFAAQACACMFDRDWSKAWTWMFVANQPDIHTLARFCTHGPGTHQSIVGVKLPDGSFLSCCTAEYLPSLAHALAALIRPCVGSGSSERPLADWQQALPPKLSWPSSTSKTEDGGGLPSTALHMVRLSQDKLVALRSRWFKLVSDTKHCFKITAALTSGCKEPPLSDTDLQPYIEDLLHMLGCPPGDHLLHRMPGQPFRLHLRHKLAAFLGDPVAKFLTELPFGVPLGVNEPLTPSPAWPVHTGVISHPEPSVECLDAWKSAQDHPDIVKI